MEFWLGIALAALCVIFAVICSVMIRRSKKWIIGAGLCAIFAVVFVFYSVLTRILFGN